MVLLIKLIIAFRTSPEKLSRDPKRGDDKRDHKKDDPRKVSTHKTLFLKVLDVKSVRSKLLSFTFN